MKWDYLIVDLMAKTRDTWEIISLEDAERRSQVKEQVGSLATYCTKMGNEGWELIAAVDNGASNYRQLFFKRLRNEEFPR